MDTELEALARWEEQMAAERGWPLSLSPARVHARRLSEVLGEALQLEALKEMRRVLVRGMWHVVETIHEHFPANVFFDVDVLVREVVRDALRASGDGVVRVSKTCAQLVMLHRLFGRKRVIRFRYVHDFVYGYDWVKWVRRDPVQRAGVTAFHPVFLDAMISRAYELQSLIAQDDATYCELPDDRPRNPFGFSREPLHEMVLHMKLADQDAIPVRGWDVLCEPTWEQSYAQMRVDEAARLGLMLTTEAVPQPLSPV